MHIEVLADRPWERDPAQGLVRIQTTRTNNFVGMGVHYGWVDEVTEDDVRLIECENTLGDEKDYLLHLNPEFIVSWRYADLTELAR